MNVFRDYVNKQFFNLFGETYIPHFGTNTPLGSKDQTRDMIGYTYDKNVWYCFNGYIYTNYIYTVTFDKQDDDLNFEHANMKISNLFLTVNLQDQYKDYFKFSLDFAPGLIVQGENVIVTMGKGDYYASIINFDKTKLLTTLEHDLTNFDINNLSYNLYCYMNDKSTKVVSVKNSKVYLDDVEISRENNLKEVLFSH